MASDSAMTPYFIVLLGSVGHGTSALYQIDAPTCRWILLMPDGPSAMPAAE